MNAAANGDSDMVEVAHYAPVRVFLAGLGRLIFGGVFLTVCVVLFYIYLTERGALPSDRSTEEMVPALPLVGAAFGLVALLILPGAIGRILSAFDRGYYIRGGISGVEICMPRRRWWGRYRRGTWRSRWEDIEKIVHYTSRINGIPSSQELRIYLVGGGRLRVERYVFAESVASIQRALLEIRARWAAVASGDAKQKAVANRLQDAQTRLAEARAHEAKGDLAAAVSAAQEAVRLDPENPSLRNWLSSFLFAQGRLRESAEALESAIALAPENALYHGELGNVLLHEGRLLGATATLRRAIALDPKDAHAHHCLGIALARTGDLAGARAELATLDGLDSARAERLRKELPPG